MKVFEMFYQSIQYQFQDQTLLKEALTHPSYSNEQGLDYDNQRLEFLGDAVVQLAVSALLYERYESADEGTLSKMRSALVNKKMLAKKAVEIGLQELLYVGAGEEQTGGRTKQSNLADGLEAVLGAMYLDGGYGRVQALIAQLLETELKTISEKDVFLNYKSILQEYLQKQRRNAPQYRIKETIGAFHRPIFVVELYIENVLVATASAASKKEAEKIAAKHALEAMGIVQ